MLNSVRRQSAQGMTQATRIQHYEVLEVLSQQPLETIYLVNDSQASHRSRCVVYAFVCPRASLIKHFEAAARDLRQLGQHARIPQVLAFWHEAGKFYVVREWVEGHRLSEEITPNKRLSESYVIKLLQDTLESLVAIHKHRYAHQNLQPNSLIRQTSTGRLFLTDFGAIRRLSASKMSPNGQLTSPIVAGNPDYVAPEQRYGEGQLASDLYSLGLIAIAALTGRSPGNLPRDPVTAQVRWRDNVTASQSLMTFLDRLLQPQPRDRFPSAKAAWESLGVMHTKLRVANDSKMATVPVAPGLQRKAVSHLSSRLTQSPTHSIAIPPRYLRRLFVGSLLGLLTLGIGVKSFQWGSYQIFLLQQKAQDWRPSLPSFSFPSVSLPWGQEGYPEASAKDLTNLLEDGSIQLQPTAAQAFWQMASAAKADGVRLYPLSGYLSHQALKQRSSDAAWLRASDYPTGYAVDIADLDAAESTDRQPTFEQTQAFNWLQQNAASYGFELSFPEGSADYEPWHWRYVGDEESEQLFKAK
ncbi:MAG: D-alanyl-D-alanine carboxypeptidase family protein [Cyanobacteria bacterium P01_D01_bin.44]